MSVFDRLFNVFARGEDDTAVRRAELRGARARAQELWAEADRPDEAARVMLLRGDADGDVRHRLALYTQAAALAPEGHDVKRLARKKRAELTVAIASEHALSAVARHDVLEAAKELEAIGELAGAAKAYALVQDVESEARALAEAGDVERLEEVLEGGHAKERGARRLRQAHGEIDAHVASGRRREALALAEQLARERPDDPIARERATQIRARRALGPKLAIEHGGVRAQLLIGHEVIVGRTEGALVLASHAVSRRHLRIARAGGVAVVEDLGSRNGTLLRGVRLASALPIGDGLDLKLGGEVSVRLSPSLEIAGAIAIEAAGSRYIAPLGPARVGPWSLETGEGEWLELVSDDAHLAFVSDVRLDARTTLLHGD